MDQRPSVIDKADRSLVEGGDSGLTDRSAGCVGDCGAERHDAMCGCPADAALRRQVEANAAIPPARRARNGLGVELATRMMIAQNVSRRSDEGVEDKEGPSEIAAAVSGKGWRRGRLQESSSG